MMVAQLTRDFSDIKLEPGKGFMWSPRNRVVFYDPRRVTSNRGGLALLHEIAHALLGHQTYELDIELVNMEVAAWEKARELAAHYTVDVDDQHIENCLESYRIWLFKRSRCPECSSTSLQQSSRRYRCFLCGVSWLVANTKSMQPRRMACMLEQN